MAENGQKEAIIRGFEKGPKLMFFYVFFLLFIVFITPYSYLITIDFELFFRVNRGREGPKLGKNWSKMVKNGVFWAFPKKFKKKF